jgi:aminoglycoside phosphotransferase (APT) family kinase protein
MTDPWEPEHPVDRELAARLIAEQFPRLAGHRLEHVGRGWDVDVWRAGETAFRFPRRTAGVDAVRIEARVLPALEPLVPFAVPVPVLHGVPSDAFPAPFHGHRLLAGTTGDRLSLSSTERRALAPRLGAWLRALHAIDLDTARRLGIPEDTFRGDVARVEGRGVERIARLERIAADRGSAWASLLAPARRMFARLPSRAPPGLCVTSHGDLYARHLLFDERRSPVAILDWGDVCTADPAVDLALVYSLLTPDAREPFFAAYGPVDSDTRSRARVFALWRHGVALLLYALDVGDEPLADEAARALQNALDA